MKKLLFSALVIFGSVAQAQICTRTGSFQGTDVSVVGTAELIQNGTTITIEIGSDFVSDAGPDLDVYLSNESHPLATGIRLEALTSLSGAQSYTVPNGILMTDYEYIVVHCTQYNHLYGYAQLGAATGNCSIALNTEQVELTGISIIQEGNGVNIKSNTPLTNPVIKFTDINGKQVKNSNALSYTQLPSKGIYFISITSQEGIFQKKILIK